MVVKPKADSKIEQKSLDKIMLKAHPQDASDDARLVVGGVGHSSDQGIEPRGEQRAETDADLRGKRRGKRNEDTLEIHHSFGHTWAMPNEYLTHTLELLVKTYLTTRVDWYSCTWAPCETYLRAGENVDGLVSRTRATCETCRATRGLFSPALGGCHNEFLSAPRWNQASRLCLTESGPPHRLRAAHTDPSLVTVVALC